MRIVIYSIPDGEIRGGLTVLTILNKSLTGAHGNFNLAQQNYLWPITIPVCRAARFHRSHRKVPRFNPRRKRSASICRPSRPPRRPSSCRRCRPAAQLAHPARQQRWLRPLRLPRRQTRLPLQPPAPANPGPPLPRPSSARPPCNVRPRPWCRPSRRWTRF